MAAQIILIIIMTVGLVSNLNSATNDGDRWTHIIATTVLALLLWWGGFWDVFFI